MLRFARWMAITVAIAAALTGALHAAASGNAPTTAASESLEQERQSLELLLQHDPDNIENRIRLEWLENGAADLQRSAIADQRGSVGPDVTVCDLDGSDGISVKQWTFDFETGETIDVLERRAYSIATRSFNIGDTNLTWSTLLHPAISQNLFRIKDGRIEQIGMGWVKHGFCAIQGLACGDCDLDTRCLSFLEPGCADPYNASLNGTQPRLGPRAEINPVTGHVPSSHSTPQSWPGDPEMPGTLSPQGFLAGRVAVRSADLDPAQNPDALYFIESQYIHEQDTAAGNDDNNASYRRVEVDPATLDLTPPPGAEGETRFTQSAVFAWAEHDETVEIDTIDVPDDGRFFVASDARPNGDGTWRYTYAVHNYNSDRSASGLIVPHGGAAVDGVGFHDVDHHSGDGINGVNRDGADWPHAVDAANVAWIGPDAQTDPNGNALRWGTLYTFWFDADRPPVMETVEIDLFKPGAPESVEAEAFAPSACPGDLNGDGAVNAQDLAMLLGQWGSESLLPDLDGDGVVTAADLARLLGFWGASCGSGG